MSNLFYDVGLFHQRFRLPSFLDRPAAPPLLPSDDVVRFRLKFLQEELDEITKAADLRNLPQFVDGLVDLTYVALGTAHLCRVPFDYCWDEVHAANMRKERAASADDNRSVRRHSLDVVKPAGWVAPNHLPILRRFGWAPDPR